MKVTTIDRSLRYSRIFRVTISLLVRHILYFILLGIFPSVAYYFTNRWFELALRDASATGPAILVSIPSFAVIMIASYQMMHATLRVTGGEKPSMTGGLRDFRAVWTRYSMVTAVFWLCYAMYFVSGLLAFLLSVTLETLFVFATLMLLVEPATSFRNCFGKSLELTKGYRWSIFGLVILASFVPYLLLLPLMVIGGTQSLPLYVGLLFALILPLYSIGTVVVYRQINEMKSAPLPDVGEGEQLRIRTGKGCLFQLGLTLLLVGGVVTGTIYFIGKKFLGFDGRRVDAIILPGRERLGPGPDRTLLKDKTDASLYLVSVSTAKTDQNRVRHVYIYTLPKGPGTSNANEIRSLALARLQAVNKIYKAVMAGAEPKRMKDVEVHGRSWTLNTYVVPSKSSQGGVGYATAFTESKDYYVAAGYLGAMPTPDDEGLRGIADTLLEVVGDIEFEDTAPTGPVQPVRTQDMSRITGDQSFASKE